MFVDCGSSTSGSGSVSFSEKVGRVEPNVKTPPGLRGAAGAAATGTLRAGTGAATGTGAGALGAGACAGARALGRGALIPGAVAAGARATGAAAAAAGAGIRCLALAADPKVCASSKKVLPPAAVLAGMAMGTKGLVVAGLSVGMDPDDWMGVNGEENLNIGDLD